MDWKKEAIQKLKGLEGAKSALTSIPEELERIELKMTGIRSASTDGDPVTGGNKREDMLINQIALREELQRRLRENELWISSVERAMSCLTEEDRVVLDRLYIHSTRGATDRLCAELNIEKSTAYYRRDNALRNFTRAYYGFEAV